MSMAVHLNSGNIYKIKKQKRDSGTVAGSFFSKSEYKFFFKNKYLQEYIR